MSSRLAIDGEAVELLARLLTESELTEIEYKQGETHIRVAKQLPPAAGHPTSIPLFQAPFSDALASAVAPKETSPAEAFENDILVKSPIVGTLYRAPDPAAPPFVQVGTVVKKGDILFIVEAMKVMNPIRAPHNGTVREICVDNAEPVEFDQLLLSLTP